MMQIPVEALSLWMFAGADKQRANISFVELKAVDGKVRASATDGHIGAVYEYACEGPLPKNPIYIPREALKAAMSAAPKNVRTLGAELHTGNWTLHFRNGLGMTLPIQEDIQFPQVADLFYKEVPEVGVDFVGLDLALMRLLQDWSTACGRDAWFQFITPGPLEPIYLESQNKECDEQLRALVMPMRIDVEQRIQRREREAE